MLPQTFAAVSNILLFLPSCLKHLLPQTFAASNISDPGFTPSLDPSRFWKAVIIRFANNKKDFPSRITLKISIISARSNICHIKSSTTRSPTNYICIIFYFSYSKQTFVNIIFFLLGLLIPNQLQSIPPIYPISTLNDKNKGRMIVIVNVINYWGHSTTTTWTNFDSSSGQALIFYITPTFVHVDNSPPIH